MQSYSINITLHQVTVTGDINCFTGCQVHLELNVCFHLLLLTVCRFLVCVVGGVRVWFMSHVTKFEGIEPLV